MKGKLIPIKMVLMVVDSSLACEEIYICLHDDCLKQ